MKNAVQYSNIAQITTTIKYYNINEQLSQLIRFG